MQNFNRAQLANIMALYSELDLLGRLGPMEMEVLAKLASYMLPSEAVVWQDLYIEALDELTWGAGLMPVN